MNDQWVTQPNRVKDDFFFNFYKEKFDSFHGVQISNPSPQFRLLNQEHVWFLDVIPDIEEVRIVVWACSSDKALVQKVSLSLLLKGIVILRYISVCVFLF